MNSLFLPTSSDIENAKDNPDGLSNPPYGIARPSEDIEMKSLKHSTTNDNLTALTPLTYQYLHMPPDCCPRLISKHFEFCKDLIPETVQRHWTFLRSRAHRLVEHRFFEWLIIASILASSTTLVSPFRKKCVTFSIISLSIGIRRYQYTTTTEIVCSIALF